MLNEALKKFFGYKQFKTNQKPVIENVLAGKNNIVIAPTGGGKSLCYQLPAVLMEGTAIVVSPLIALMKSQVDFLNAKKIQAGFLNSTLSRKNVRALKTALQNGKVKLLYIAPETLNKKTTIAFLNKIKISFIAIDEAHCISDWGHDFRPEYRKIKKTIESLNHPPVIALTATATPQVQQDIIRSLNISDASHFIASFDRPNLYYEVQSKNNFQRKLIQFIHKQPEPTGIIYCQSRKKAESIADFLVENRMKALPYHAGLDNKIRTKNQDDFLAGRVDIIAATIAFGMGIDKPDVRFVVHFDVPKSLENYYQETGRAGRDGKKAHCLLFYAEEDMDRLQQLNKNKLVSQRKNMQTLLESLKSYAVLSVCRRKQILNYFGETYKGKCDYCDNCVHPNETYEGKEYLKKVLEAIQLTAEKFEEDYIIKVLGGIEDAYILDNQHHTLPIFGAGKDHRHLWPSVIKQALLLEYLKKSTDDPSILHMTPTGLAFLKKPHAIQLYKDHTYDLLEDGTTEDELVVDSLLLDKLQDLRDKEAIKNNLQPYLIFQDTMLERMATTYPTTIKTLTIIPGIGLHKAEKFGMPFIQLIANYIQQNNIEPIEAVIVRQNPAKFANRIHIIQQIDHQIDLEQIAKKRMLSFEELITELENICATGVRLNLDYYIDKILDKKQQEDLYRYFYDSEVEDIQAACDALVEEYTEDQIRLMHIKFLSEVAN